MFAMANLGPLMLMASMWAAVVLYLLAWACQAQAALAPAMLKRSRLFLSLGAGALLYHAVSAFHFFHGWSHAAAVATLSMRAYDLLEVRTGALMYAIYFYLLVWVVELAWSWAAFAAWGKRPGWVGWPVRIFLAGFGVALAAWVGGVSVYEVAPLRWSLPALGLAALLAWEAARWMARRAACAAE